MRFGGYVVSALIVFGSLVNNRAAAPVIAAAENPSTPVLKLPALAIGLNKFELFRQYLGRTTKEGKRDATYQHVSQAMAMKAMIDARNIGVTYFRVGITGISPRAFHERGELDLWMDDSQQYWALFDQMMNDLHANDLHIIPVFVWQATQMAAMAGEKSSQLVTDPNSKSYKLLEKYVTEFVQRYKDHPAVYFYELTNELNLGADLDEERRCHNSRPNEPERCEAVGNMSTAQMIAFTRRLAALIRKLDRSHLISSGFAVPRRNAEHLRAAPEFVNWSARRPNDSVAEFKKNLKDIHQDLDIASIHLYNQGDNERFGITGHQNADILRIVKQATDEMGKRLFVGEFADKNPTVSQDRNALFTQAMLKKIVELRIPFSAPWCWEFYHRPVKPDDMGLEDTALEPGLTDSIISKLVEANVALGNPAPAQHENRQPPTVIVTYPLEGSTLAHPEQAVHVVASSAPGVSNVTLLLDGKPTLSLTKPPYKFKLKTTDLSEGQHEIIARAYDASANVGEYRVSVIEAMPASSSASK